MSCEHIRIRNPTIKVNIIDMLGNNIKLIEDNCIIDIFGNNIKLRDEICMIDINNDNILLLYDMIKYHTGLINIGCIIINNYKWTYTYDYYVDLPNDSDDDDEIKIYELDLNHDNYYRNLDIKLKNEPTISSIIGENYNKDKIITVQLMISSYIDYINHKSSLFIIKRDKDYYFNNRYDIHCNNFKNDIAKLNENYILLYEYEQIKRFLKRRLKMYQFDQFNHRKHFNENMLTFMLEEIKKYLILF